MIKLKSKSGFAILLSLLALCLDVRPALAGIGSGAPGQREEKSADEPLKKVMHDFLRLMDKLRPYLLNDAAFANKANESFILDWLEEVRRDVAKGRAAARAQSSAFNLTLDEFQQHLAETESHFRAGKKTSARQMLAATTQLCISCHTQLPPVLGVSSPLSGNLQGESLSGRAKVELLNDADYRFITHQYESALLIYNHLIRDFAERQMGLDQLRQILRKKLIILAKVKQDPNYIQESLDLDLKNKNLPDYARQNIKEWLSYVRRWKKDHRQVDQMDDRAILQWAQKELARATRRREEAVADGQVIRLLRISGVLYRRLHRLSPGPDQGRYLLLLSRCERFLNDQFFYGLSELFLKQCIHDNRASMVARDCYRELEDTIEFAYQSTTGLEIPEKVQQELDRLRKEVGLAQNKIKSEEGKRNHD